MFNSVWIEFIAFSTFLSFEVDALFGVETSTLGDAEHSRNDNNVGNNDIRRKFTEPTTSPITDVLQDDGQIGTTSPTESNQSSRKKVTDTASSI